jgi:hypothetical protein
MQFNFHYSMARKLRTLLPVLCCLAEQTIFHTHKEKNHESQQIYR